MMRTPIANALKRKDFVRLAELQDRMVESLYELDSSLILHGGTAIWRCYEGNRFSYDIDAYLPTKNELNLLAGSLTFAVRKRGIQLDNMNSIKKAMVGQVSDGDTLLKFDVEYSGRKIVPVRMAYSRSDGSLFTVLTLTPEDFILEKIVAYKSRKYLRDLYDIFHLIDYVKNISKVKKPIREFISDVTHPENSKELDMLVYNGVAPSFDDMVKYIKGRSK